MGFHFKGVTAASCSLEKWRTVTCRNKNRNVFDRQIAKWKEKYAQLGSIVLSLKDCIFPYNTNSGICLLFSYSPNRSAKFSKQSIELREILLFEFFAFWCIRLFIHAKFSFIPTNFTWYADNETKSRHCFRGRRTMRGVIQWDARGFRWTKVANSERHGYRISYELQKAECRNIAFSFWYFVSYICNRFSSVWSKHLQGS